MRLIDADALLDKQECLFMKRHILFHGVTAYTIESAPTIAPETLPVVRELRSELAKAKAERDALATNSRPVVYGEWRDRDGNPVGWDEYNPGCPARQCWCSNCGEDLVASDEYPVQGLYCPHCGADMRGKSNE